MPIYSEVENALKLLDDVQKRMSGGRLESTDPRQLTQVNNDLNTLLSVLSDPMFQRLCKIQDSVNELGSHLIKHPSITPNDFEVSTEGKLILKISPPVDKFRPTFDKTPIELNLKKKPIPTAKAASSPPISSTVSSKSVEEDEILTAIAPSPPLPRYIEDYDRVIAEVAGGRQVHRIKLNKPEGTSLGFSVVGLKSQEKGELGIFVQEIQPTGLVAKDGRLAEGDQILAIDGQPLDSAITHQQAIGILQQARGEVEIVVARTSDSLLTTADPLLLGDILGAGQQPPFLGGERPSSPPPTDDSTKGTDMVLNTEWAQVEVIELINDGTGLGFGIIGGRSTGVVVKTILPGGVADRDGRLQSGDHILQIGEVNLLGMGSEQVAAVLRQCGSCVRLVVARPIEPTSPDAFTSSAPIVPTRILGDPEELERHLLQANGYGNHLEGGSLAGSESGQFKGTIGDDLLGMAASSTFDSLPEVELVEVELKKDSHGLGITIAGYVCEKEELSGIFVKSISEGSAADVSGKISINDRIVEVDGQSLQGFTNHQAVEVLRKTGPVVILKLERYHHGSKYEQLQSAISHSEHKPPTPSSVSALSLPQVPVDSDGEGEDILASGGGIGEEDEDDEEEDDEEDDDLMGSGGPSGINNDKRNVDMDLEDLEMLIDTKYDGEIYPTVEAAVIAKWSKIVGPTAEIVVSQLSKAKEGGGLGISLEGTVDVEDGREVRPHHYIRSILQDGPVGRAGKLLGGDELLEVNGRRLLGLNHVEVVSILKDLPISVRIVCARRPGAPPPGRPIDTAQDRNAFAARNILGGSLQNLFQGNDRLVKAKSDGSLASTGTTGAGTGGTGPGETPGGSSLSKLKSRSLEPLTGLAMWSSIPTVIELPKGDRGLGFSILDYQDPMNPNETLIVIRSLVPGGVAQQDGRLIPGDRLLAVNSTNLENATLDQAVQALKGAPRGMVRIAVAKPLPLPDSMTTISSTQSQDVSPPPLPISPPPPGFGPDLLLSSALSSPRTPVLLDSADHTIDTYIPPGVPPPPPRNMNEIDMSNENEVTPIIPISATERLITCSAPTYGRPSASVSVFSAGDHHTSTSTLPTHQPYDGVSVGRGSTSGSPAALPVALERTTKIKKAEEPLGINVELVDDGVNGVMVTSVAVGGPFHRDGRIQAGDYLVTVNNEGLRNVTNAQARAILRRAQLFSKDLSVSYIPAADAEVYRDTVRIQSLAMTSSSPIPTSSATTSDPAIATSDPTPSNSAHTTTTSSSISSEEQALVERSELQVDLVNLTKPRTPADGQESLTSRGTAIITRKVSPVPPPSSSSTSVFIGGDILPPATQPTVQKRVVTHVTIFPSPPPPPDLVQVVRAAPPKPSPSSEHLSEIEEQSVSVSASISDNNILQDKPVPTPKPKTPPKRGLTPSSSVENTASVSGEAVISKEKDASSEEALLSGSGSRSASTSKGASGTGGTGTGSGDEGAALLLAKHWGPERLVEVQREAGKSLGISIVGGKVDLYNAGQDSGSAISGIFIKNVLPNSPAGRTGQLKTGDRILAVDDVDLRSASHEKAVDVIRAAGNPVRFLVQSLVQWADGRGQIGIGVTIANHEDSEASERSEGTETKSVSQNVPSQSQEESGGSTTGTATTTSTGSRSYTTTSATTSSTGKSSATTTNGGDNTQRRRSGIPPGGESVSEASAESQIGRDDDDDGDEGDHELDVFDDVVEGSVVKVQVTAPQQVTSSPPPPPPPLIQPGLSDEDKKQNNKEQQQQQTEMQPSVEPSVESSVPKQKSESDQESDHSSEEEDELGDGRQLQGKTRTKRGIEIDRASAGNVKRSKSGDVSDSETEDEFGYTTKKVEKRWGEVSRGGRIIIADLERSDVGLGISLAGHRDRMKMATYICGINPAGAAHRARQLEVGDEILEVNGIVLYGRCHLNASAMIKSLPHNHVKIIAIRKSDGLNDLSVKPIVQFPVSLMQRESPEEKYASYKGLRVVTLKKSGTGLGVMIMEGRHAELGQGIFISDIQDGSPAEQAGLFVGDMILAVNSEDMVGSDYEHAANTLKKTEGNVILVVCNASKGKDEEQALLPVVTVKEVRKTSLPGLLQAIVGHDSGKDKDVDGKGGKDVDKPKLPPKPSKIPSPSKLISSVSSAISHRTKISVTSPVATPVTSSQPPMVTIVSPTSSSCSSSSAAVSKLAAHGISPVSPKQLSPSNSHTALAPTTTTPSVSTSPTPSVSTKPATPSPRPSPIPPSASHKMTLHVHGKPVTDPLLDPISCPINPGKETTIEINKDKMGLGLSIVGGSDTLLGSIIIHEVYADGAASKDGRLKPGDQLLSVNHEDFQNISHSKALAALRQTPNKVRMVVYRDESATREDDMYDLIDVELVKKSGKGLGLSIVGRKNGSGVFISDVVPGGIAELHGGLMKGDMIITVDGKDLKNATQEEAASILKTAIGPIRMKIGRLKAAASRRSAASTPVTVPATPTSDNNF
ncbi:multiple PDZ domain protein isoform X3 [Folsomia candida]|uniref:multiple PDZ domain protein isoform X3 n=1 Tax=Folsomia candida TaxID=158441 RepID=UPI001604A32A|nr:multiple PDZ domain protein isoform X3 [Folsomia candida]